MKVLLTGAKGWTGKAVLEVLGREHQVRAFDRLQVEWPHEPVAWQGEEVTGDIADYETVRGITQGVDAIVHMAVASHRSPQPYGTEDAPKPAVPFAVNVNGTYNILESARRAGIRRVIIMASAPSIEEVRRMPPHYADADTQWMDRPTLYALTKYLQERLGWFYALNFGMEILVLRCGFIVDGASGMTKYGVSLRETNILDAWVDRYDVAQAILRALTVPYTGFEIFYLVGYHGAEPYFDLERTRQKLGMQFRYRFEEYG